MAFRLVLVVYLLCGTGGKCVVVKTRVGDDAVLPCEVDPTQKPNDREMVIEWSRLDLPREKYVHFQRNGGEVDDDKSPSYKNRTSLFTDEVKNGNLSLKLYRVNSSDAAYYTCRLNPDISQNYTVVQLIVEEKLIEEKLIEENGVESVPGGVEILWWCVLITLGVIIFS